MTAIPWWGLVLIGLAGGLINALLVHNGVLYPPRRIKDPFTGRKGLDTGFIYNLLVGAAAGWLAATAPTLGSPSVPQTSTAAGAALTAFFAGVGGAAFITSFLQQRQIDVLEAKVGALNAAGKKAARKAATREE